MKENHVREHLSAYLDQMLTADENSRIETHLRECPECKAVLSELSGMVTWMKKIPKPAAQFGLETRLMARLKEKQTQRTSPFTWKALSGGLATAMVALIVFVMVRDNRLDHNALPQYPSEQRSSGERLKEVDRLSAESADLRDLEKGSFDRDSSSVEPKSFKIEGPLVSRELKRSRLDGEISGAKNYVPGKPAAPMVVRKEVQENKLWVGTDMPMKKQDAVKRNEYWKAEKSLKAKDAPSQLGAVASGLSDQLKSPLDKSQPDHWVIRSKDDWIMLQYQNGKNLSDHSYDAIDFSKQMIIATNRQIVSAEFQNEQGRRVLIIKVRTAPPLGSEEAGAKSAPTGYEYKVLSRFDGPVQFRVVK